MKELTTRSQEDEHGDKYIEIEIDDNMAPALLDEGQFVDDKHMAILQVYVTKAAKKSVVIKDDDLLTKQEMLKHSTEVAAATLAELKTWNDHACFEVWPLKDARNVMTSWYVAKWKWIQKGIHGY